jgi:hypothetical protein
MWYVHIPDDVPVGNKMSLLQTGNQQVVEAV